MEAVNVKCFQIISSTFSILPRHGLTVTGSARTEILDSVFEQIQPQSIVVERTKELVMVGNQFGESDSSVLSYRDSTSVLILCNRVVGTEPSPECVGSSHSVSAIGTTATYTRYQYRRMEELMKIGEIEDVDWIVVIFGVILLIASVSYISYMGYYNMNMLRKLKNEVPVQLKTWKDEVLAQFSVDDTVEGIHNEIPDPPTPPEPSETETLLLNNRNTGTSKKETHAPVLLNEIHSNNIFNKQKLLIQDSQN